uniref:Uncharacterized protein C18orf8-like protein n=1 Tax=Magallana gigas TaxID=29159 RepID=K1P5A5_MAGGI
MADEEGSFYIELCKNPIRFDPVDKVTNVFYDDANKQVFTVRSGGAVGVVVKGPSEKDTITFRMESRGDVSSIKFSPDRRILAVQRSPKSVEFVNFNEDMTTDQLEYSQTCKGKSTIVSGFVWTSPIEIVFITDHGIEFYQITPERRTLKCLKTINISVCWFVWLMESSCLLLASGTQGNQLNPFFFRPSIITKLTKFEVDLPSHQKSTKQPLLERDVSMANIDVAARKTDIMRLELSGRFAINVVNNLIVVHHQASRTSVIFDINLDGESDGFVRYHHPVHVLAKFLLARDDSKRVILNVCRSMLSSESQATLSTISKVLDMLNKVYQDYLNSEIHVLAGDPPSKPDPAMKVVIDQSDMYTHVFSVFEDNKSIKYKFMVAVLIEYIRSLSENNITVQHYLYELIINILVHNNCFYQLHQFLQYHVLQDSKPLACLMLSLESVYPPAHQLALDMLKRLSTANEEIIEVLLSKQQLLPALRFIRSVNIVDAVSSRKFLEAAMNTDDAMLFYTVFKFFEQRNVKIRGNPRFQRGEHCEMYVKHFEGLFGTDALAEMVAAS